MPKKIMYPNFDCAIDQSWEMYLDLMAGGIVRSRIVDDLDFYYMVKKNVGRIILHCVFSGFEGSVYEPEIPKLDKKLTAIHKLARLFKNQASVVAIIDPFIPTAHLMNGVINYILGNLPDGIRIKLKFLRYTDAIKSKNSRMESLNSSLMYIPWDSYLPPAVERENSIRYLRSVDYYRNKFHSISVCCDKDIPSELTSGCIDDNDFRVLKTGRANYGSYVPSNGCNCSNGRVDVYSKYPCLDNQCIWCTKEVV